MVGSIKQTPTLVRSEGALELQDAVQGEALQLLRRVPQGEGLELSDPLGEGLEVRRHPVDRAVGVVARAVLVDLSAQRFDERPAELGVQAQRSSVPAAVSIKRRNSVRSRRCSFCERALVVTSKRK